MKHPGHSTTSDYVLQALEAEGVSLLFGLIGEGNSHLLDRVHNSSISFVQARHEQAAVKMADGYARTNQDVAVCTLTHGPGVTNAATGIACADRDGVPIVVLIGDTSRSGRETSLQYLDHKTFTSPISGYQTRAESVETVPELVRRSFKKARDMSRPTILEIPSDVQSGDAPSTPYRSTSVTHQSVYPDPDVLNEAASLIDDATNPVILAGGGAMRAAAGGAIQDLAEKIGAPIATTYFAKGLVPESHSLVSGIAGTFMSPANDQLLWDADVVVVVGSKLSGKATRYGKLYDNAQVIQIDIDQSTIGLNQDPTLAVIGDASSAVKSLVNQVDSDVARMRAVEKTIGESGAIGNEDFEEHPEFIDPREFTMALSDVVPDDSIITVDSGNNTGFPAVFHEVGDGGKMLVNGNFGSMGYALPAALGAKLSAPEQTVVCYTGDGALLQVIQELETGVRLNLPIIVAVLNDQSYGIIRHRQQLEYGRETASSYESPSFEEVAKGLGVQAATIRSIDQLEAVTDYLETDPEVPLLLDVRTNPDIARPGFPPY